MAKTFAESVVSYFRDHPSTDLIDMLREARKACKCKCNKRPLGKTNKKDIASRIQQRFRDDPTASSPSRDEK